MIGRLRGILLTRQPPQLTLEVQGVGYDLEAPMSTFYELPPVGSEVVLHTHRMTPFPTCSTKTMVQGSFPTFHC